MAVTPFQSRILKLLADNRRDDEASYVAGGVALNLLLRSPRLSHDIDLFHDAAEAVWRSWHADRALLLASGYQIDILREATTFVEARVTQANEHTILQWVRDSAYRFFPLIDDPLMGFALHPFDLATNKALAMAGRLEVRDWVNLLHAAATLQPLGLLLWAACGKDPGYNPVSLLAAVSRHHYSQAEVDTLVYEDKPPCAAALNRQWREALAISEKMFDLLRSAQVGTCLLESDNNLFCGDLPKLEDSLSRKAILFHHGSLRGVWPQARP